MSFWFCHPEIFSRDPLSRWSPIGPLLVQPPNEIQDVIDTHRFRVGASCSDLALFAVVCAASVENEEVFRLLFHLRGVAYGCAGVSAGRLSLAMLHLDSFVLGSRLLPLVRRRFLSAHCRLTKLRRDLSVWLPVYSSRSGSWSRDS